MTREWRRDRVRLGLGIDRLEGRMLLAADVMLSQSGNEILLHGDSSVTTLAVSYDLASEVYSFKANSGVTFAADGSLPGTVVFSHDGSAATLVPNTGGGNTWAGLGYAVGTNLSTTTGTAVKLGGPAAPASNFGTVFDLTTSNGGTINLAVDDSDATSASSTIHVSSSQVTLNNAGPTFDYGGASLGGLTVDASNAGSNTLDLTGSPSTGDGLAPTTLAMGTGTGNSIDLGNRADGLGTITVTSGSGGSTALQVDDSNGNGSWVYSITATSLGISSGSAINYRGATLAGLTLSTTNNGGNTINVTGTPSLPVGSPLGLGMFAGAGDAVNLGDSTHAASGLGGVKVGSGNSAPVALTVNDSADTTSRSALLKYNRDTGYSDFTGISSSDLSFNGGIAQINLMPSSNQSVAMGLTVDFANGSPFFGQGDPAQTLSYDANGGGKDTLTLLDSAVSSSPVFAAETYSVIGPNGGSISFNDPATKTDQGGVTFLGLSSLTDSTPVTNYTFTAPISGGTIAVVSDPTAGYNRISDPSTSPSFEQFGYSKKANVTIDASAVTADNLLFLDDPAPASGQSTLTVDLGDGNDTVDVVANPAGVATTINGGAGSQMVNVSGAGLAAGTSSSNFSIVGGARTDTLRLNAQGTGTTVGLVPGGLGSPSVAVFGRGDGATSIAFKNMSSIQEFATNHAPSWVVSKPLTNLSAELGLAFVDVPVAIFNDADLIENAGSYLATIAWGDGTTPTAGTIAADPNTPGKWIISGSHTYLKAGNDTITVTLTDLGGTFNSTLVNDTGIPVPVSTQLDPGAPVAGATATVAVQASNNLVSISGRVFRDVNADGLPEAGEPGLAGRAVFLDVNRDGTFDPGDPSAVTDGSGQYTIAYVPTGTYTLRLIPVPGDVLTGPVNGSIKLNAKQSLSAENFALQSVSTVSPVTVSTAPFGPGKNPDLETAIVKGLYSFVMGRAADPLGLAAWTKALKSKALTVSQVSADFYHSTEYDTRIIKSDYQTFLRRGADPSGLSAWVKAMQAGLSENQVAERILGSAEYSAAHADAPAFVEMLYEDVLGRTASRAEVDGWVNSLDAGASRASVVTQFVTAPEAERRIVIDNYIDFLGRMGSEQEMGSWLSVVQRGSLTLDQAAEAFCGSPEFAARAAKSLAG